MFPENLISQEEFFAKFPNSRENFEKSGLEWNMLEDIYADYIPRMSLLDQAGALVFNTLMKSKGVHSVRYRIKDPEHLIEKIIRKKKDDPKRVITIDTYSEEITDIIGARALHLFKDDWTHVHDFVNATWDLKEQAVAYIRKGDDDGQTEKYKLAGLKHEIHKKGYRSLHYTVETKPGKVKYYAEIQVRTIFEEAWGEIDHTIRYPYDQDNLIYTLYLGIMNRLAGTADEMGTFISILKEKFEEDLVQNKLRDEEMNKQLKKYQKILKSKDPKPEELSEIAENLPSVTNWSSLEGFREAQKFMGFTASDLFKTYPEILGYDNDALFRLSEATKNALEIIKDRTNKKGDI